VTGKKAANIIKVLKSNTNLQQMTSLEAKQIADEINKPVVEEYLEKKPLSRILHLIADAAAAGEYVINYNFENDVKQVVVDHIAKQLMKQGFDTQITTSGGLPYQHFVLRIEWSRV
jgi:hypothetical protein